MRRRAEAARARSARRGAGFTLIEVLVALAIVAVTLAAGLRAAGSVTSNADRIAEVVDAQWCADNELTRLQLTRAFPGEGEADFSCTQRGRSYAGTLITRATPNANFRRVEARVRNADGQGVVSLSTIVGRF